MSLFSDLFGGKDTGAAYNQQGLAAVEGLTPPNADDLKVQLQQMVYQGDLTPEQMNTVLQNPSLLNNMTYDTTGKGAQLEALSRLQGISTAGGMTPTDLAQLNDIESRTGQMARGAREATMQNAAERGMSGSGTELLGELTADQNAATMGNTAGLGVAAQAQQRALQAIQAGGALGGQIENQNYGEAANAAQAQDMINKFNAANSQSVQAANVAANNAAAQRNLETRQNLSDTNTGIKNQQATFNAQAPQTAFEDQVQKAGGVANQAQNLAAGQRAATNQADSAAGGLLGAGTNILSGGLQPGGFLRSSDETKKKDIKDVSGLDLDSFMESLNPKKFKYKDPNAPGASDGENVGVMAQDVEKTPVGKTLVKDTPNGKMIDMKKSLGALFAALAELHSEVKEKEAA